MTMKNFLKNRFIQLLLVFILGIIVGLFIISGSSKKTRQKKTNIVQNEEVVWTCSMHPQIRMDKPGKCPICGMDLIPANTQKKKNKHHHDPNEISISPEAARLAGIETDVVRKSTAQKEIRLLGRIKPDERYLYTQSAHIPGRIERLYVNFTGERIFKGQKLAKIYSPELLTAQKELFEAMKIKSINPQLYQSVRNKLKLWKLTDEQIQMIEQKGEIVEYIDILSDYDGIVMKRMVENGDHVKEGQGLFEIADLSHLWILLEAYESDLPWIKLGNSVEFMVQGKGNQLYRGKVDYIMPFIDPQRRVAFIRVDFYNPKLDLLPEMYVDGLIRSKLNNDVEQLIIPKSAVLWTGKRSIVYVAVPERSTPTFLMREIELGADMGDFYIVKSGLKEGEEIAVNGTFRIDAAAQLSGKKSMMQPEESKQTNAQKTRSHQHIH